MTILEINHSVPDFTALATGGEEFDLQANRGKNIVLYFYPKDCTPGCTLESQNFRDYYAQFQALNTIIIGISRDNLKLHAKFKTEQQLPFALISDPDEKLCQLFNVMRDKNMYGKKVRGVERSTFLIDSQGVLRKAWRKVKVEGHAAEVLQAVENLI